MSPRHFRFLALLPLLALAVIAAEPNAPVHAPAPATTLYKSDPGPHPVESILAITLRDDARDKDLLLRVSFPKDIAGPTPLIVLSHGAMGSKDGLQPLTSHWASHGYIVVQPTHGDSLTLLSPEERRRVAGRLREHVNSPDVLDQWDDRPRDVKLILDSLDAIERQVPALKGRIDRARIGQGGHSFGAHTSMLIAGLALKNPRNAEQRLQLDDPRPGCFVFVSPQGPGPSLDDASYARLTRPALYITGDNDGTPIKGQERKAGLWRRDAFDKAAPGDKYLLWINGAFHDFGGINGRARYPGSGEHNALMVTLVKTTSLAMWDAYLKDDPAAKQYLKDAKLQDFTDNAARLERR